MVSALDYEGAANLERDGPGSPTIEYKCGVPIFLLDKMLVRITAVRSTAREIPDVHNDVSRSMLFSSNFSNDADRAVHDIIAIRAGVV
jgi:hypothetical protein